MATRKYYIHGAEKCEVDNQNYPNGIRYVYCTDDNNARIRINLKVVADMMRTKKYLFYLSQGKIHRQLLLRIDKMGNDEFYCSSSDELYNPLNQLPEPIAK